MPKHIRPNNEPCDTTTDCIQAMKKSKLQQKIWRATKNRNQEQRDNNRRAAWNRVGLRFALSKDKLEKAKTSGLNPYRLLRNTGITADSAKAYIEFGHQLEEPILGSLADLGVFLEMEETELEGNDDTFF